MGNPKRKERGYILSFYGAVPKLYILTLLSQMYEVEIIPAFRYGDVIKSKRVLFAKGKVRRGLHASQSDVHD